MFVADTFLTDNSMPAHDDGTSVSCVASNSDFHWDPVRELLSCDDEVQSQPPNYRYLYTYGKVPAEFLSYLVRRTVETHEHDIVVLSYE
jgi:hypothetical protein